MDFDWIWVAFSAALGAGLFALSVRAWGRSLLHGGGRVDRDAWRLWAAQADLDFVEADLSPRVHGVYGDCSVEISARIRRTRSRRGGTVERATTSLRISHRAELPPGFLVQTRSLRTWLGSRLFGAARISVDEDIDAHFHVESSDPFRAREILADLEVKKALLALAADLPEAVVHERALEATLPGMVTEGFALSRYLDLLTALGVALRAIAPQVDPVDPEMKPLPTAAELPRRHTSLASALRGFRSTGSSASQAIRASSLKIKPYEYTLIVRAVTEAANRLGRHTGGRAVRGVLDRSAWRAEIHFDPEDNEVVEALEIGDVITGMCLVEDLRPTSQVVECKAMTPPLPKAAP